MSINLSTQKTSRSYDEIEMELLDLINFDIIAASIQNLAIIRALEVVGGDRSLEVMELLHRRYKRVRTQTGAALADACDAAMAEILTRQALRMVG